MSLPPSRSLTVATGPLANQLCGQLLTDLCHQRAETGALFFQAAVARGTTDVQGLAGWLDAHAIGRRA